MGRVTFSEFQKLDLRVGEIKTVKEVEGLDKIYKLEVDIGEENSRTLLAGLKSWFKAEDLIGLQIVVVTNLEPKTVKGITSEGMLLAADPPEGGHGVEGRPVLVMPCEKVKPGTKVR